MYIIFNRKERLPTATDVRSDKQKKMTPPLDLHLHRDILETIWEPVKLL